MTNMLGMNFMVYIGINRIGMKGPEIAEKMINAETGNLVTLINAPQRIIASRSCAMPTIPMGTRHRSSSRNAWHDALHELVEHGNRERRIAVIGAPHHPLRNERAARRCQ
jgi:hypothetical protein